MTTTVLILHGSFGSPYENWFPSAFENITEKGIRVFVPHLPTPVGQTFTNWSVVLDAYLATNLLDENSIIVGHSSACVFALKYALEKKKKFGGLVTVAGFNNLISGNADFDKINSEFFQTREDLVLSSKLFNFIESYYSHNDPYIPSDLLEDFTNLIGSKKHLISKGGHFNRASGYTEFPELLKLLTDKLEKK